MHSLVPLQTEATEDFLTERQLHKLLKNDDVYVATSNLVVGEVIAKRPGSILVKTDAIPEQIADRSTWFLYLNDNFTNQLVGIQKSVVQTTDNGTLVMIATVCTTGRQL